MALPAVFGLGALVSAIGAMLTKWVFEILIALGVSFVSYKFTSALFERLLNHIQSSYFQLDHDLIGVLGLAGIPEAFNIVFGAFNFCVGLFSTGKVLKFFGGKK